MTSTDLQDNRGANVNDPLFSVTADVIRLLTLANQTVGVAESLTGGGVMEALTSVPGASAAFRGGIVSYATPLKQQLLGVEHDLIEREGVIHPTVAEQMAEGARKATECDGTPTTWGIGTTGVAGPAMQNGKPVGTVYIGVASAERIRAWGPFTFPGTREQIREATVMEAMTRLRELLQEEAKGQSIL